MITPIARDSPIDNYINFEKQFLDLAHNLSDRQMYFANFVFILIQSKQHSVFFAVVMYAYEQALLALGFFPNIWYQAALYLEDRSKQLFERGVSHDSVKS